MTEILMIEILIDENPVIEDAAVEKEIAIIEKREPVPFIAKKSLFMRIKDRFFNEFSERNSKTPVLNIKTVKANMHMKMGAFPMFYP